MNEIKIEKNIPIPTLALTRYPFKEMEIGDSFFVTDKIVSSGKLSVDIQVARQSLKMGFKQKRMDGGTRVWRIR